MNSRILPPEEWPRLAGTEAEAVWPTLDPEHARVVVVEDEGEIVATWTVMRIVHVECLWVKPSHRGVFGVTKRLLRGMRDAASAWGARNVVTGSASAHVTDLIRRFGGMPMPCESFVLPVEIVNTKAIRRRCAESLVEV